MLGWFRTRSECPIDQETRQWLDRRWEWLEETFGRAVVVNATVVLPRAEFFPDPYQGTEEDVRRMLDRACKYMGIDPATIELYLYFGGDPDYGATWDGTAGYYNQEGEKHYIGVEVHGLDDPVGLVATLAHELSHVHLLGHGRLSEDEADDHEPLTDLLTIFLGLGVFTANAVIHESYWSHGQHSAWSMHTMGYLRMPECGYALARFARARGEDGSAWSKHLRLDVRTVFKQAMRFLAANGAARNGHTGDG